MTPEQIKELARKAQNAKPYIDSMLDGVESALFDEFKKPGADLQLIHAQAMACQLIRQIVQSDIDNLTVFEANNGKQ